MKSPAHIVVRGLTHVYASGPRSLAALAGVDIQVGEGEFVSVIGPSGGGKTTLLKVIGGLLDPTSGHIRLGGMPAAEAQRRKAIGFVFQDPSLLPWRTVFDNILLPLELNPLQGAPDLGTVENLLETVGLAEFRDYYPRQLSGGMRQRVAFARALAINPEVLLMDEPLGGLDEITRAAMRFELLRVWEASRKTVVLVTHSVPEAVMMSDRVAVMSSRPGRILRQVRIDLPRPRDESLEGSAQFLAYANDIRESLSQGVSRERAPVA